MADKSYNGWSSYETWCINLWIGSEQSSDAYWREQAQECWNESETERSFSKAERATLTLADRLKDEIEEGNPLAESASLYSDLIGSALSEVNWYEIAAHFIADCDQTWEESDEYETAIDEPRQFVQDAITHLETQIDEFAYGLPSAFGCLSYRLKELSERVSGDQCECADRGCPVHKGNSVCKQSASTVVYRVDMEDRTGTRMCDGCASDALESGCFRTA